MKREPTKPRNFSKAQKCFAIGALVSITAGFALIWTPLSLIVPGVLIWIDLTLERILGR